jgi:hypothetical protein
MEVLDEANVI